MNPILRQSLTVAVVMTALTVLPMQPASAAVAYLVTVNTSTVNGTAGFLDFQFNPVGPASQPATAQILNFTGGTLGPPPTGNSPSGCFATPTTTCGAVTGTLPSVTLMNTNSLNEYFQAFTYGNSFTFLLVLSGPAITSPNGSPGSTFCLGLYDSTQTPILTNQGAATGCAGLVLINSDGSTTTIAFPTATNGPSVVTFTAVVAPGGDNYQVGFAANLQSGDSIVNLTNSGVQGGFIGVGNSGNICVNVYAFDPQEEEVACCACLVTPDGLNSLSAQHDLISNTLTPATPGSITIDLIASQPGLDSAGGFTVCNPSSVIGGPANVPYIAAAVGSLAAGLGAWGTTLEPASSPGTFGVVPVEFLHANLSLTELSSITSTCSFIQSDGTNYGICKSCRVGGLGGAKK